MLLSLLTVSVLFEMSFDNKHANFSQIELSDVEVLRS